MKHLDHSCGGLLPLIPRFEASPAVYDDRNGGWLTREELRSASLDLANAIASDQKRLGNDHRSSRRGCRRSRDRADRSGARRTPDGESRRDLPA
jgi:hypothetical protein